MSSNNETNKWIVDVLLSPKVVTSTEVKIISKILCKACKDGKVAVVKLLFNKCHSILHRYYQEQIFYNCFLAAYKKGRINVIVWIVSLCNDQYPSAINKLYGIFRYYADISIMKKIFISCPNKYRMMNDYILYCLKKHERYPFEKGDYFEYLQGNAIILWMFQNFSEKLRIDLQKIMIDIIDERDNILGINEYIFDSIILYLFHRNDNEYLTDNQLIKRLRTIDNMGFEDVIKKIISNKIKYAHDIGKYNYCIWILALFYEDLNVIVMKNMTDQDIGERMAYVHNKYLHRCGRIYNKESLRLFF